MISTPRSASAQPPTTTYSSSSCRNASHAFSQAGSATSTKSASTPDGLNPVICPCSIAVNRRFTDSVVYARCERISSSESFRAFCRDRLVRISSSLCRED